MRIPCLVSFTLLLTTLISSQAAAVPPVTLPPETSDHGSVVSRPFDSAAPDNTIIITDYNPIVSLEDDREHGGWRSHERFEISNVSGLREIYDPGEKMDFLVKGQSDRGDVEAINGFDVVVTLFDLTRGVGKRAEVDFDSQKRAWQVWLTAPKESGNEFKMVINLFCKIKDSQCANTHGFGTQVDKSVPLHVR